MDLIKDWILPLSGFVLAIVSIVISRDYAGAARADAEGAQRVLDQINTATATWQREIITATVQILNSTPQVVEGRLAEERTKAAQKMLDNLATLVAGLSNTNPNAYSTQRMDAINHTLDKIKSLLMEMK